MFLTRHTNKGFTRPLKISLSTSSPRGEKSGLGARNKLGPGPNLLVFFPLVPLYRPNSFPQPQLKNLKRKVNEKSFWASFTVY